MESYVNLWLKWVAITTVVATLLFFSGYHVGYKKATVSCVVDSMKGLDSSATGQSEEIAVYVVGEVVSPGVYFLSHDTRVQNAIEAAGGFTASADIVSINLAMKLADGMKIYVPPVNYGSRIAAENGRVLINVNMASIAELESIPGIGPVLAKRIYEYRQRNGPFSSYEDLLKVSGIGEKTLEKIKPYIQVP